MLIFRKRDIASGDMRFGERLQLEQILAQESKPEIDRVKDIIECLHGFRPCTLRAVWLRDYAIDCAEGLIAWIQREREECTTPPTSEATRAGVDEYSRKVGNVGTVIDLADRFKIMPFARVYELPYMDVFAIWKADAERAKFERRLRKVYESDAKAKQRR